MSMRMSFSTATCSAALALSASRSESSAIAGCIALSAADAIVCVVHRHQPLKWTSRLRRWPSRRDDDRCQKLLLFLLSRRADTAERCVTRFTTTQPSATHTLPRMYVRCPLPLFDFCPSERRRRPRPRPPPKKVFRAKNCFCRVSAADLPRLCCCSARFYSDCILTGNHH